MKVSSSQSHLMANQTVPSEKTGAVTVGKSSPLTMVMRHCGNVSSSLATSKGRKASHTQELTQFRQQGCNALLLLLEELPVTPASSALKQNLEALKDTTTRAHFLNISGNLKEARNVIPEKQ